VRLGSSDDWEVSGASELKILWIMKKYLDVAVDKSARIEILSSLRRQGHDPRLLVGFKHTRSEYGLPGAIAYVPSLKHRGLNHATFLLAGSVRLAWEIAARRPDVVVMDAHTCWLGGPWHLTRRLRRRPIPFVLDVRTVPVEGRGTLGRLEERLFRAAIAYARRWMDGMTVISPFMRQSLAAEYGLDPERIGVWSSGVSLEHFDPARYSAQETTALRKELGLDGQRVLLYHGAVEPNRGVATAIRALAALGERADGISLLVVGRGSALPAVRQEAERLGLSRRVVVREAVSYADIPRYLAVADAGMLPLPDLMWWRVSSPIKLMEYLAMGKPVLVTDIEAHRDVLGDAPFAYYAGRGEVEPWAKGMLHLHTTLDGRGAEIATATRAFARDILTWDRQAERLAGHLDLVRNANRRENDAGATDQHSRITDPNGRTTRKVERPARHS
jgi:glycosyltransferase involved in cell wall biosynthesis